MFMALIVMITFSGPVNTGSLLNDEDYLRMEIENHGRLFIRNSGNSHRWLIGAPNPTENTTEKDGSGWAVQLSTSHLKPTTMNPFEDYRPAKMKRKQIIDNLESRLWYQKAVQSFTDGETVVRLKVA